MELRVSFLIDGLNLYHSLLEVEKLSGVPVRWLDVGRLCASYLHAVRGAVGQRVELACVDYFSAMPTHLARPDGGAVDHQRVYLLALREAGVRTHLARFKRKDVRCPSCGTRFVRYEEKETDVAIAIRLMEVVTEATSEIVVVVSGDTDLLPALKAAKRASPSIRLGIAFPFLRHNAELKAVADFTFSIGQRDVQRAQFPAIVPTEQGVVSRPAGW
jgi:NYN domain